MLRPDDEGHFDGKDVMANHWPMVRLGEFIAGRTE
jgi:hypothetical protein